MSAAAGSRSAGPVKLAMAIAVVACLSLSARSAWALSMPVTNGGVLTATQTVTTLQCGSGRTGLDHILKLTNFAYSLDTVTNPSLMVSFDTNTESVCAGNPQYTIHLKSGCDLQLDRNLTPVLVCAGVFGYVGPKYIVVGVSYAPPGPTSFVQYSTSASFGTTTSLSNSFTSSTSVDVSTTVGGSIGGFFKGSLTISGSASATQSRTSSTTTTVSVQNLFTTLLFGIQDAFHPIDHDYDLVWLWLNPVMLFTVHPAPPSLPSAVTLNGYGYDVADQPAMDIWPIEVGYLNGHFGPLLSEDAVMLSRSWAATQVYPPGHGPGLTSDDFADILRSDPFATPGYTVTLDPAATPVTTRDGRFTISGVTSGGAQGFVYRQPAPGSMPLTQTLTNTYTNETTLGRSSTYESQVGFGIESSVSADFVVKFSASLKLSQTFTRTHQAGSSVTNTAQQIDTLSITGPPCGSATAPCVPVYTGPSEFDVYQDNIFGAFMFNPVR